MSQTCRYCRAPLALTFADLGSTPLANSYLPDTPQAIAAERSFPLHVMVCGTCRLVQTTETVPAEAIFDHDYAYLSSYSTSWVAHAGRYARAMTDRFGLGPDSLVAEVASNDGYLLQHFVQAGIPVLGIEPAGHAARLAEAKGVPTRVAFFGAESAGDLAGRDGQADLIAANNVLAHVPDIRDFAAGFPILLKPEGVVTFEFPHLLNLIRHAQFDTIYHEHYSYLSLLFVEGLLDAAGLRVFDVEELSTHGGSLRVFACHQGATRSERPGLAKVRGAEAAAGLDGDQAYAAFGPRIGRICADFRAFIGRAQAEGATLAGYGAAAKGNTFLNTCGATRDTLVAVADKNPEKRGTLLPGTHIPVISPEELMSRRPDYVLILPWNLKDEIAGQLWRIRGWGGRFVTAIPALEIF